MHPHPSGRMAKYMNFSRNINLRNALKNKTVIYDQTHATTKKHKFKTIKCIIFIKESNPKYEISMNIIQIPFTKSFFSLRLAFINCKLITSNKFKKEDKRERELTTQRKKECQQSKGLQTEAQ